MSLRTTSLMATALLASCTSGVDDPVASSSGEPASDDPKGGPGFGPGEDPEQRNIVPVERAAAAALPRGRGHEAAIVEVWLDPRASAAMSVDAEGAIRLWPTLPTATSELAKLAPIRVPIREPRTLSFARSSGDAFVIAAIDTSQSARVIEVEIDAQGQPGVRERFSLPPNDPLLELMVFDGGERLLGLGVDHRLRLYDGQGKLLSVLSEYGFSPWQLRVSGPPEAPKLAVVLAGPTRLQRIALENDAITKVGVPHAIKLDRGPNLNDLALLPSGKVAAVLRRPKAKSGLWVVELHDLDSGGVKVLWGEATSKRRLRMHVLGDDALLLEGNVADGYRLDLGKAVLLPPPAPPAPDAPPLPPEQQVLWTSVETLPPESRATPTLVPLPQSGDVRQVSVVGSLRAGPSNQSILFDPIDSDRHFKLGNRGFAASHMRLDPSGTRLAIQPSGQAIAIVELADMSEVETTCSASAVMTMDFTDPEHLLLVGSDKATICAWRSGEVRSELALTPFEVAAIHTSGPGKATLGLRETTDEEWRMRSGEEGDPDLRKQVAIVDNAFGTLEPLSGRALSRWPELDTDLEDKTIALDRTGNVYVRNRIDTRHFHIDPPEGKRRKLTFAEKPVDLMKLAPSPDGKLVAMVQSPATDHGPYGYGYGYYDGYGGVFDTRGDPPDTLTLFAIEGDIPVARFSAAIGTPHVQLSWSDDGTRLAVHDRGGVRVFDPMGEVLFDRRDRKLTLEDLPDVPPAEPAKR